MAPLLRALDRLIAAIAAGALWLALPMSLLLFVPYLFARQVPSQ